MIKVERKVVHGSEQHVLERLADSPSQTINTAYVERSNLDWRLCDAHLARKAPTVARAMRWAESQVCHLRGLLQFDPTSRNAQPR